EHRKHVAHGAADREEMPDHEVVADTLPDVKDRTDRVAHHAGREQPQRARRHGGEDRLQRKEGGEAEATVGKARDELQAAAAEELRTHADKAEAPYHTREAPTPRAAHGTEQE